MNADAALPSSGDQLTRSAEDYLKVVFLLSGDEPVATTQIAQHLNLAPASVSGMIRRLAEQGLLEHEPYRGVELTAAGREIAVRMVRRHRIIETYLVAHLGYRWDDVHEEAERLEHAVSDLLVERMAVALGHPESDPHGDPIPTSEGRLPDPAYTKIPDLELGETATVGRVTTGDQERLRYIASYGLIPGAQVTLLDRQPFNGPLTVLVNQHEKVLGYDLAALLLCVKNS